MDEQVTVFPIPQAYNNHKYIQTLSLPAWGKHHKATHLKMVYMVSTTDSAINSTVTLEYKDSGK